MNNKNTLADKWLKDNGFNVKTFATIKLEVAMAQRAAKMLLTEYASRLTAEQIKMLHAFQRDAGNSKKVDKISNGQCYKIFNICTKYNRSIFNEYRKTRG